jgi:hypothetical protein
MPLRVCGAQDVASGLGTATVRPTDRLGKQAGMGYEPSSYEALTAELHTVDPYRRYGRSGHPIAATETYRRVISTLRRDGIRVERWILVNERDQTVTYAFTYDGLVGAHYDAQQNTHALNWERLRPKLDQYQYVSPDECLIAWPISSRPVTTVHGNAGWQEYLCARR